MHGVRLLRSYYINAVYPFIQYNYHKCTCVSHNYITYIYTRISYAAHGGTPTSLTKSYYIYIQSLVIYFQVHLVYTQHVSHAYASSILYNIHVLTGIPHIIKFIQFQVFTHHRDWFTKKAHAKSLG